MKKLSVAIITLNEEERLPDCLRSAAFADEILVVDSGSHDRTKRWHQATACFLILISILSIGGISRFL